LKLVNLLDSFGLKQQGDYTRENFLEKYEPFYMLSYLRALQLSQTHPVQYEKWC